MLPAQLPDIDRRFKLRSARSHLAPLFLSARVQCAGTLPARQLAASPLAQALAWSGNLPMQADLRRLIRYKHFDNSISSQATFRHKQFDNSISSQAAFRHKQFDNSISSQAAFRHMQFDNSISPQAAFRHKQFDNSISLQAAIRYNQFANFISSQASIRCKQLANSTSPQAQSVHRRNRYATTASHACPAPPRQALNSRRAKPNL